MEYSHQRCLKYLFDEEISSSVGYVDSCLMWSLISG